MNYDAPEKDERRLLKMLPCGAGEKFRGPSAFLASMRLFVWITEPLLNSLACWHALVIQAWERDWSRAPWPASTLLGKFQASERCCFKRGGGMGQWLRPGFLNQREQRPRVKPQHPYGSSQTSNSSSRAPMSSRLHGHQARTSCTDVYM